MARNNRQKCLRKFDNVKGNIEKAMAHLNEIGEMYAEGYPEHTQNIAHCVIALKASYDMVSKTKELF